MSKFILSVIFILFFFAFISSHTAYGILGQQVPGLDCGLAEDTNGKDICCQQSNLNPTKIVGQVSPGGVFNQISKFVTDQASNILGSVVQDFNNIRGKVHRSCLKGSPSVDPNTQKCTCIVITPAPGALTALTKFCENIKSVNEQSDCVKCVNGNNTDKTVGVWTSAGCVYTSNMKMFIEKTILGFGVGLAGIIALLCIIYASFRLQTSSGNPESIKKAQELLTSCIIGLMLIIFSVFILRLIGVDILRIPGFGR